jgi:arylsulfatase A-like enzyme
MCNIEDKKTLTLSKHVNHHTKSDIWDKHLHLRLFVMKDKSQPNKPIRSLLNMRTLTFFLLVTVMQAQAGPKLPNIVFILADDLGYGDVRAMNPQSKIPTPNIDRIAQAGITFTDAHSPSSVCTPTRYGILTGRYAWRTRLKKNVLVPYDPPLIESDRTTMPGMLRQRGYRTAAMGKWHLGLEWTTMDGKAPVDKPEHNNLDYTAVLTGGPVDRGFDHFFGMDAPNYPPYMFMQDRQLLGRADSFYQKHAYRDCRIGTGVRDWNLEEIMPNLKKQAVNYIRNANASEQPFFLYLPLTGPHTPIAPSQAFKGKSGLNVYADFVMEVDDMVGGVLDALRSSGQLEHTIVIFSADNGCSPEANFAFLKQQGHHPSGIYRGHKADIFEGGHRVPLLVQWPARIPATSVVSQTVCLTDFMATFASLTGYELKQNEAEDAYNILPLLLKPDQQKTIREATVHHSYLGDFAIRQGKWKLILTPGSGGWSFPIKPEDLQGLPPTQLYDLEADPGETKNLATQFPDKAASLKALLDKYQKNGRSVYR